MDHYWTYRGRPVLFNALEAACRTVQRDLAIEVQRRDAHHNAAFLQQAEQLRAATARADWLQKDNRSLREKLEHTERELALQKAKAAQFPPSKTPLPVPARPALAAISGNAKANPSAAGSAGGPGGIQQLEKEYSKLAKRYAALEARHEETHRKAKEWRDSQAGWAKYAESLEAKLEKLKKLRRSEGSDNQPPAPNAGRKHAPVERESTTASGPPQDAVEQSASVERAASTPLARNPQRAPGRLGRGGRPADEETEDESGGAKELPALPPGMGAASAVAIKEEPSSDSPVIVSERSLRKRKHTEEVAGADGPRRRIKTEESTSSDLVITAEAAVFSPHESIDLDEEQHGMPTPKKQRRSQHQRVPEDEVRTPREEVLPPSLHPGRTLDLPASALDTHASRPVASGLPAQKSTKTHKDSGLSIKADWSLRWGISDVAEETFESFHSPKSRKIVEGSKHVTPAHGRLQSLLNNGSPEPTAALLRPPRQERVHADKADNQGMEAPQDAGQNRTSPEAEGYALDKSALPKPSRLRDRPLADLRTEDFKVNPKFNDGYKHAFDEVVRNKGERAELAGCTDPTCCGRKFRAMAESELNAGGPGVLSRAADTMMLEKYLGNEAHRLVDMTREEKQELWLKAKTQDLADRHGRHRHRFARRPSPPGYWNPDFPSTQEIGKSKEEGDKMERRLVEERWREAMRGGGRWLFRDE